MVFLGKFSFGGRKRPSQLLLLCQRLPQNVPVNMIVMHKCFACHPLISAEVARCQTAGTVLAYVAGCCLFFSSSFPLLCSVYVHRHSFSSLSLPKTWRLGQSSGRHGTDGRRLGLRWPYDRIGCSGAVKSDSRSAYANAMISLFIQPWASSSKVYPVQLILNSDC